MYLSGELIREWVQKEKITIDPLDTESIRPASYVVHLAERFRSWDRETAPIRIWSDNADSRLCAPRLARTIILEPGEFVLGHTVERIGVSEEVAGVLSPLSHVARFGSSIHNGAGWVNPGF